MKTKGSNRLGKCSLAAGARRMAALRSATQANEGRASVGASPDMPVQDLPSGGLGCATLHVPKMASPSILKNQRGSSSKSHCSHQPRSASRLFGRPLAVLQNQLRIMPGPHAEEEPMKIKRCGSGGSDRPEAFALVEVILASGLVIFLFASLYLGISFGFSVTDFERQNLRATQIILERMEGLRLLNWNQLTDTALNPTTFSQPYYPAIGSNSASGVIYTGQMTVSSVNLDPPASYSNNMKQVTVTLTWSSGSVSHSRTLSTYASRNGIQNYIYSD
jgi:hypothetical protein